MLRLRSRIVSGAAALATLVLGSVTVALAPAADAHSNGCSTGAVTSYIPPAGTDGAFGVTQGPGGTWYAHGATINRIVAGKTTEYPVPDPDTADAGWLTRDSAGGQVWFADRGTGRLGTVDVVGRVHEYQIPDGVNGTALPQGIVVGPGSHVWFTDQGNDRIGDLDRRTGAFTLYPIPTEGGGPLGLTRGPDGNLWFTERGADKVGRMTPAGAFTEWDLAAGAFPNRIVTGPDRALWFTELRAGNIGRITTAGQLTEVPVAGGPVGITLAPDGHLYAAMFLSAQLAQLDDHGQVARTWDVPGALQVAASQGALWVTDPFTDTVSEVRTHCDD